MTLSKRLAEKAVTQKCTYRMEGFLAGGQWTIEQYARLVKACRDFKASFDKGFPNSLSAIQARDEIFEALEDVQDVKGSQNGR